MVAFVVIIGLILLGISTWNLKTLRDIKKMAAEGQSPIADAKYYELKYNIQFLVGMSTVLITVLGSLGYNSIRNVETDVSKKALESINPLMKTVESVSEALLINKTEAKKLDEKNERLSNRANEIEMTLSKVTALENKIDNINKKNILKQNYYVVPSIKIDLSKRETQKIFFKDLITNNGDRLPNFKSPPLVFGTQDLNATFMIFNVTESFFQITSSAAIVLGDSSDLEIKSQVSLMIIEK